MTTVFFDFRQFLIDKRITAKELSEKMQKDYTAIWRMTKHSRIKLPFLRDLEKDFGDLSNYIKEQVTA